MTPAAATPAFVLLAATWLLGVVAYGAVEPWARGGTTLALLALAVAQQRRWPTLPALGTILLAAAFLQLLPIPAFLQAGLQPEARALHGASWGRISLSPHLTAMEAVSFAGCLLAGLIAFRAARGGLDLDRVALFLTVAGTALAGYGLLALMQHHEMLLFWGRRQETASATGTFVNRNHFAGCLELILPLSIAATISRFRKARHFPGPAAYSPRLWQALTMAVAVVVMIAALILSRSRLGIASFLAACALMAFLWRAAEARRTLAIVLPLAAALGAYIGLGPLMARFETGPDSALQEGRFQIWRNTLDLVAAHPVAGTGFGAFDAAFPPWYHPEGTAYRVRHPHNEYLALAAEVGPALALLLIGAAAAGAWRAARRAFASQDRHVIAAVSAIAAILVHSLGDFNLRIPSNGILFAILAGFVAARVLPAGEPPPATGLRRAVDRGGSVLLGLCGLSAALLVALPNHPADAAPLLQEAEKATAAGRPAEGLRLLRRASDLEPLKGHVHFREGEALRKLRRHDEADREIAFAARCEPEHADLQFRIGDYWWSRYRETRDTIFRARALLAFEKAPVERTMRHLASRGATEEDLRPVATGTAGGERAFAASRILSGVRDPAVDDFLAKVAPGAPTAADFRALAAVAREVGWPGGAIRVLEALLEAQPDAAAWMQLSSCWEDLGAYDDALAAAVEARRLDPDRADHHAQVGRLSAATGDGASAVDGYAEAVRLAPAVPWYTLGLAQALRQGRRTPEAERALQEFQRRSPGQKETGVLLAQIYIASGRRDDARDLLAELARRHPDDAEIGRMLLGVERR